MDKPNLHDKIEHLKVELDEVYHAFAGLTIEHDIVKRALIESNRELEAKVAERTHHLEEALALANAANRAKSEFLAAMSHEIRTPMNSVVGMIDLMLKTQLEEKQALMMCTAREASLALLKLIDEVLDFSKIEAGKIELDNVAFDLNHMIANVFMLFQAKADESGLLLSCFIEPSIRSGHFGDRFRLRQVLTNLVGNAVKFTPAQSGRQGRVSLRIDRLGEPEGGREQLRIEVSDNGVGMSQAQVVQLFQNFTQGDPSTTRRFGGTGLGLAISKGLVERMGGHIEARSTPGLGSCFTVYLPLEQASLPPGPPRDLSGLTVMPMLADQQLAQDLCCYARYWKAEVQPCADREQLRAHLGKATPGQRILICSEQDYAELAQFCETCGPLHGLRFIVLSTIRHGQQALIRSDTLRIESYPLHRTQFLEALAVVAGLESPETQVALPDPNGALAPPTQSEERQAQRASYAILVAEDNPANQMVMRMQLEVLGYRADFVENGVAALEAYEQKAYELILTDCHMPLMDGYDLTRLIRERERESGVHVPIIAVTANALQGEERHCLDAGMDGYTAKPIVLPRLEELLQRWLGSRGAESAPPQAEPQPVTLVEMAFDDDPIFNAKALDDYVGDYPDSRSELLRKFSAVVTSTEDELKGACEAGDLKLTVHLAHRFKSAAKCFGAHRLARICQLLETAAREQDRQSCKRLMAQFITTAGQLQVAIQAHLGG